MFTTQIPLQRDGGEIGLGEVLGTLKDNRWRIIIITAVFVTLSVIYALVATPIYQASAMVQVEQKVLDLPGLSSLTQTLNEESPMATTESDLITSRMVIGGAVSKLNLAIQASPRRFPLFGNFIARYYARHNPGKVAPAAFGLTGYDWGGAKLDIFQLDVPDELQDKPLQLTAGEDGIYVLQDDNDNVLVVGRVGQPSSGHGVTMQVKTLAANPGMRFRVFRHRDLTVINGLQKQINVKEDGKDSGVLRMTYNNADPKLAASLLEQVGQLYVRQNVDRNSAEATNSLRFVKEQLPTVRMELEKATDALNAFQNQSHSVDVNLQTQSLLNQNVSIESNLEQLRLQQADMQRQFTPAHPQYQALMKQIGELESQKASVDKQIGGLPDAQKTLLKLNSDVQVSNQTYQSLLNQAQQLDIARAGTVGNVRIVDNAAVDVTDPAWPKKLIVVLGGAVLGFVVAMMYVFLRQVLYRGIEDPAVIENLGLPVYATIPISSRELVLESKRCRGDTRQHLLVTDAPADLAAEALRSLRTSLHFARLEAKNNVLMISGASPDTGKTFVSANLAAVVAQSGQRVLLIDGDLRMGTLHSVVGGKADVGLSELISGQAELTDALRPVAPLNNNLHFIGRGRIPPNPSELLMHTRFTLLLDQLKPKYDLIIIDTPPILAVTDAAIIGNHSGTGLLVARFGVNQPRELNLAKQRFEQNGVVIKGAIFNAVEKRSTGYYSYAYYAVEATDS
jgi:tyrosine-protein kinase Etk/Wzc